MTLGSENQTQDTLVGGEHSYHCAIPTPLCQNFTNSKSQDNNYILLNYLFLITGFFNIFLIDRRSEIEYQPKKELSKLKTQCLKPC